METHTFFLYLMIILISARLLAELASKLKIPSVVGELMAGILLGPSLLGWIAPFEAIKLMAEIGIILLLFEAGLETDVKRLVDASTESTFIALFGILLPLSLGFAVCYWGFKLELLSSLFIGGALTATSIGITIRILADLKQRQSKAGQIALGAAVLDDILGVILLALLFEFSLHHGVNWLNAGKALSFMVIFFLLAPVAAKVLALIIHHFDLEGGKPALLPTSIISLVLFFAWLAHELGAPEILGGFAAGLALSRRFFLPFGAALRADANFAKRIQKQMEPIVHLFTPIFFVYVGLSVNLQEVNWQSPFFLLFSSSILVVAIIGKVLGALFLDEPWYTRMMTGAAMIPRGEVGLIFTEMGRSAGIFNTDIYASLVLVIVMTTLLPAFFMKWLNNRVLSSASKN
jgi:Kef-type K+ transport system membrane component KefB